MLVVEAGLTGSRTAFAIGSLQYFVCTQIRRNAQQPHVTATCIDHQAHLLRWRTNTDICHVAAASEVIGQGLGDAGAWREVPSAEFGDSLGTSGDGHTNCSVGRRGQSCDREDRGGRRGPHDCGCVGRQEGDSEEGGGSVEDRKGLLIPSTREDKDDE